MRALRSWTGIAVSGATQFSKPIERVKTGCPQGAVQKRQFHHLFAFLSARYTACMPPQHSMRLVTSTPRTRTEIRQYRLRLGLTQVELARQLGIRAETISQWERGVTCPSAQQLLRLAKTLGTLAEALYPEYYRVHDHQERSIAATS